VINIIGLLVSVVANVLLIPQYAMTGATVAALRSSVTVTVLIIACAAREIECFIFPVRSLGIVASGVAVTLIAFLVRNRSWAAVSSLRPIWPLGYIFERREWTAALTYLRGRFIRPPAPAE
jgi:O-antigen/teichoic acid export membrane protein